MWVLYEIVLPPECCKPLQALNWQSFGPERLEYNGDAIGKCNLVFDLFSVLPRVLVLSKHLQQVHT